MHSFGITASAIISTGDYRTGGFRDRTSYAEKYALGIAASALLSMRLLGMGTILQAPAVQTPVTQA